MYGLQELQMPSANVSVPWPLWFQQLIGSMPLPKSHSPVQVYVVSSVTMPSSSAIEPVIILKTEPG